MLMPTKIIKPVDSLFSISAYLLKILSEEAFDLDKLHDEVNKIYYKNISLEKIILSLNFLYTTDKVRLNNEIITINLW